MALNLMLQGTMSNAGKSLLAAALCRIFKQDGYRVAPFKSQNMALNSFITAAGGEMGRAQVVQAEAAGLAPDVRMNPILLKPTTDVGSQVIVNGQVVGNMRAMEYYRRKREFLPAVLDAYAGLDREYDVLVIEGAGSPAEINLKQDDFVNMGLAKLVDAPVLLIGDIDRGGVFAQLYGTIALLESDERARVKGTIINKFRGDRAILEPGLRQLEALCGVPVAGVVPYTRVDIDEEDSLTERFSRTAGRKLLDLAVIRLPRISNFTDFSPFERYANVSLRYISSVGELGTPDMILLPGTKSTIADLSWLRQSGLDQLDCSVALLKNVVSSKLGRKDIIKIDRILDLDWDVIGYVDPGITVNIIKDGQRVEKRQLKLPERIRNVIRCKNPRCITSVEQELPQIFTLTDREKRTYRCLYCETKAERQ